MVISVMVWVDSEQVLVLIFSQLKLKNGIGWVLIILVFCKVMMLCLVNIIESVQSNVVLMLKNNFSGSFVELCRIIQVRLISRIMVVVVLLIMVLCLVGLVCNQRVLQNRMILNNLWQIEKNVSIVKLKCLLLFIRLLWMQFCQVVVWWWLCIQMLSQSIIMQVNSEVKFFISLCWVLLILIIQVVNVQVVKLVMKVSFQLMCMLCMVFFCLVLCRKVRMVVSIRIVFIFLCNRINRVEMKLMEKFSELLLSCLVVFVSLFLVSFSCCVIWVFGRLLCNVWWQVISCFLVEWCKLVLMLFSEFFISLKFFRQVVIDRLQVWLWLFL